MTVRYTLEQAKEIVWKAIKVGVDLSPEEIEKNVWILSAAIRDIKMIRDDFCPPLTCEEIEAALKKSRLDVDSLNEIYEDYLAKLDTKRETSMESLSEFLNSPKNGESKD